jgi:DHA1 family inner membrane transport protein
MIALGCAAFTFFLGAPIFVALMAREWGFTPSQIGSVVTADTVGNTLGALAVARGIRAWPVRRIMASGMVAMIGGNALIAAGVGLGVAIGGSLVAGIGNGIVSGTAIGFLTFSDQPQRNVGLLTVGQNLYAMLLMALVLPAISAHGGAGGAFLFISGAALVCLPAMLMFTSREIIPVAFREGQVHPLGAYVTLLTLYVFYVGVGIIWTFLATRAEGAGLPKEFVQHTLAIANFASLGACFLVTPMARHHLYGWSLAAVVASCAAAWVLQAPLTPSTFVAATLAFVACWTLSGILVPTLTPAFDPVGRHVALTPAFLGMGYSTGSFLGGMISEHSGGAQAFQVAAIFITVAMGILVLQRVIAHRTILRSPAALAPLGMGPTGRTAH